MPVFEFRGRRYDNPAELALQRLGGKWKMPILWRLKDRVWRYGELKRGLGRITHKMLAQQLRELERDGLVTRTTYAVVPPRVDYAITDLGRAAMPVIEAMRAWGATYRKEQGRAARARDADPAGGGDASPAGGREAGSGRKDPTE